MRTFSKQQKQARDARVFAPKVTVVRQSLATDKPTTSQRKAKEQRKQQKKPWLPDQHAVLARAQFCLGIVTYDQDTKVFDGLIQTLQKLVIHQGLRSLVVLMSSTSRKAAALKKACHEKIRLPGQPDWRLNCLICATEPTALATADCPALVLQPAPVEVTEMLQQTS